MKWNVADLLEAIADAYPGREALVVSGRVRLSWSELDERANRLANFWLATGMSAGDHVGCYCANGNEYLEAMLACFKARMVPINVNWRYKPEEIAYLFDDADIAACIVDPDFRDVLEDARTGLGSSRIVETGEAYEAALAAAGPERPMEGDRSPDDRYFLYTGGTTGYPKGVEWRQEDIIGAVWRSTGNLDMAKPPEQVLDIAENPRTRYFAIPPFMHGAAHWGAFGAWLAGGVVMCMPTRHLDAAQALWVMTEESPNLILIVGDAFAAPLLAEIDAADAAGRPYDLSGVRILVSSGAPLSQRYKEAFQERIPRLIIADTLGSSEAGVQAIAPWRPEARKTQFVLNDVTAVLDEETLEPLDPGSGKVGVLAKSGYLPLGYYKDPEKTSRTFPVAGGKRWVVTGDHAITDSDGTITLLGRGSNCINTGGEKVYPEEVEEVIKALPEVVDVLVVGVPDDRFGSAVTAVVESPGPIELGDLRAAVEQRLAGYKAPRHVVRIAAVPRAPSGKPDYPSAREYALTALGLDGGTR